MASSVSYVHPGYGIEQCMGGGVDYDSFRIRNFQGMINMINDTLTGKYKTKINISGDKTDTWEEAYHFMKRNKAKYAPLLSHTFFGLYKLFCLGFRPADDAEMKTHAQDFMTKAATLD